MTQVASNVSGALWGFTLMYLDGLALLKIVINLTAYSLEVILKAFLLVACQSNLDKRHNGYLVLRRLTKRVFVK